MAHLQHEKWWVYIHDKLSWNQHNINDSGVVNVSKTLAQLFASAFVVAVMVSDLLQLRDSRGCDLSA